MTEQNLDMLGFDDVSIEAIKDLDTEDCRWPEAMRQMYDILKHELIEAGVSEELAIRQLSSICKAFGGMQFYLPRGNQLANEIKHLHIWNEFTGNNVTELSRKYDVSMQHIYRVIAKMRNREVKKRQHDLF
ncbi:MULTISPECIES: Mor transcription activator family protein [Vibrio]|uniref:Transcriptional regulator n=1 Tax=Vibrio algicola TaxID=2662262 RepID=A0A5Q0TK11_9VIBR|nr:Mor transcription activator family protein [Vibrio algicola]